MFLPTMIVGDEASDKAVINITADATKLAAKNVTVTIEEAEEE